MTRVAVAISTRDRPEALRRCLASLRSGAQQPAEVVVADQSDGPEAGRIVAEAADAGLAARRVDARSGGLGAAQNDAVAATSSEVVAVLDDDCVADENWLLEIDRAFEANEALALLAGRVLPAGPPAPGLYAVSSRVSTSPRTFSGKSLPWDVGSGNNFAFRREWFDRIGGCNEQLGPGAPLRGGLDMDLFYRMLRAGGEARYEPSVLVLHDRTTKAGRISRRSAYGYGMAAAIGLWLRERDLFALRILWRWLMMRTSLLLRGLARGRWNTVREEALVLGGTMRGLARALVLPPNDRGRR